MASISVIVLRLILLLRAINKNKINKKGRNCFIIREIFVHLLKLCDSSRACTHSRSWLVFVGFGCRVRSHSKWPCSWRECLCERTSCLLVRATACTCLSASTVSYKHLIRITCSVVKFTQRLIWSNFRLMSAYLSVMSLTSLGNKSSPTTRTCLSKASFSTCDAWENARLQVVLSFSGCYDPMYVDNNCIQYDCEELMHEFDKAVKPDGWINLQREGELDWLLSVRYNYDKVICAIGCNPQNSGTIIESQLHRLSIKGTKYLF